jgi:DDE family transposase
MLTTPQPPFGVMGIGSDPHCGVHSAPPSPRPVSKRRAIHRLSAPLPPAPYPTKERLSTSLAACRTQQRNTRTYYRQRTAVERGFGRLKNDYGLLPLRVRRQPRVALHASLTILAQLASALLITRDT